jgi:hypothetical protein
MALSPEEFGEEYASLILNDDSGFESNDEAIAAAEDPYDERRDFEQSRRLNAYGEVFVSREAIFRRAGPFLAGSGVNLYEDADGASWDLNDEPEDIRRNWEGHNDTGKLLSFKTFSAGVGEESLGVIVKVLANAAAFQTAREFEITHTIVSFRQGRVVGVVAVTRVDSKDVTGQLVAAARKLDERILSVLDDRAAVASQKASSVKDEAGLDLLREVQTKMGALQAVRVQQRQTVRTSGEELDYELDIRVQFPDKTHVRSNHGPGTPGFEIAMLGLDVYIKDGAGWGCLDAASTLNDLGVSPPDFTAQFDIAAVADRVLLLSPKKVDGETLQHIRAQATAEKYLEQAASLLGESGPLGAPLTAVKGGNAAIDLFVGDDAFVRQARVDLQYLAAGEQVSVFNTALFSDYDKSFAFPLQPPYPSCSGKRS